MPTSSAIKTQAISSTKLAIASLLVGLGAVAAAAAGTSATNACATAPAVLPISSGSFMVCPGQALVHSVGGEEVTYTVRGYSESLLGLVTGAEPKTLSILKQQTGGVTWQNGVTAFITYQGKLRNKTASIIVDASQTSVVSSGTMQILYQPGEVTCVDSDNGYAYDVSGVVNSLTMDVLGNTSTVSQADYCYTANMNAADTGIGVAEQLCAPDNQTALSTFHLCPYGCSAGACLNYFPGAPQLVIAPDAITDTTTVGTETTLYAVSLAAPNTNNVALYRVTFALDASPELAAWIACGSRLTDTPWKLVDVASALEIPATIVFTNASGSVCAPGSTLSASYATVVLSTPVVVASGTTKTLKLVADTTGLASVSSGTFGISVPVDTSLPALSPYYGKATLWWPGDVAPTTDVLYSGNYLGLPLPAYTISL